MLHSNVREKSKQDRLPNRSRFDKNKGHPASVTRGNSALFGLVHHTQDNPASRVPSGPLLVCLACLRKGEHGVDDGPKVFRINQGANLDQFITVGFNTKPERAYAMRLRVLKRRWGTDNGDKHPSWFDHLPGSLQGGATNGIEDEIDIMNPILEARGGIVNDLVQQRGSRAQRGPARPLKLPGEQLLPAHSRACVAWEPARWGEQW